MSIVPWTPFFDMSLDVLVFTRKMWPIEIKDVEKRVIVEDMNRYCMWTVARRPRLLTNL
jgi:hypothetical protein